MQLIITQPVPTAHANPDAAARQRTDRLAQATIDQMQKALAFLSVIDPEAFEIAFTAVTPATDGQPRDEEPVPVCRACGATVGIFPEHGLAWRHYRGDGITSGAQEIYDPCHSPDVAWCLPTDGPEDL
ncbi:MAG TPA: hypothetical protein VIZ43_17870 [Trebonia sp.]